MKIKCSNCGNKICVSAYSPLPKYLRCEKCSCTVEFKKWIRITHYIVLIARLIIAGVSTSVLYYLLYDYLYETMGKLFDSILGGLGYIGFIIAAKIADKTIIKIYIKQNGGFKP